MANPRPDIYVLSLKTAEKRREAVRKSLDMFQLPFQFVDAPDFRTLAPEEGQKYYKPTKKALKKQRFLQNTEIACALGHQHIYKKISEGKSPFALILEDDAFFLQDPRPLLHALPKIEAATGFDVLLLAYVKLLEKDLSYLYRRLPIRRCYRWENFYFGTPWQQFSSGTVAYVITREAAKKLLSSPIRVTADDWLYYERHLGLNIYHMRPLIALENVSAFASDIRKERENFLHIKPSSRMIRSLKGWAKNFLLTLDFKKGSKKS